MSREKMKIAPNTARAAKERSFSVGEEVGARYETTR
jgi:hypothetical protein